VKSGLFGTGLSDFPVHPVKIFGPFNFYTFCNAKNPAYLVSGLSGFSGLFGRFLQTKSIVFHPVHPVFEKSGK